MRITIKDGHKIQVKAVVSSAAEALTAARRERLAIVVVPHAAWLVTPKVAANLQKKGYEVIL